MVKHRITTKANHVNNSHPKSAPSNQSPLPPLSFQFSQTILPVREPANLCGHQHFTARSCDAGSSPLDRARTAASSPRNDLVKNYQVHPTHWLISTQQLT